MADLRRGELVFFAGPMDSGKSTLALQMAHTQAVHGRRGILFTSQDRSGQPSISSRIGLSRPAVEVDQTTDLWAYVVEYLSRGEKLDFMICDEAQFYQPQHIDQLARIVDDLGIDVFCFGILADFRTQLFPGSKRLVELADRVNTMPVHPLCWCGQPGLINARVVAGQVVTEGSQVLVGDTNSPSPVGYEVLCRRHYRLREASAKSGAVLSAEPLPFTTD